MSEIPPPGPDPDRLALNYQTQRGKLARFAVYCYAVPFVDIDHAATEGLKAADKLPLTTMVDMGSGGLSRFMEQVEAACRQDEQRQEAQPLLIGLDPNMKEELWLPDRNIKLVRGTMQDLASQVDDRKVEVMSALMSLYHQRTLERTLFLIMAQDLLRGGGVFVDGTSGEKNKHGQRGLEEAVAEFCNVAAPEKMNERYTSEVAVREIPQFFPFYYQFEQRAALRIRYSAVSVILDSIRSLRDQFNPIPPEDLFEAALNEKVTPFIDRQINAKGYYTDFVHRTVGLASDEPLTGITQRDFKRVA